MRAWELVKQMFENLTTETPEELAELSDQALLQRLVSSAGVLSYYNAAEGPDWYKEQQGRQRASRAFAAVKGEVEKRGLKYELKGYLV